MSETRVEQPVEHAALRGREAKAEYLNGMASVGFIAINSLGATVAAILGWLIVEKINGGKSTVVDLK